MVRVLLPFMAGIIACLCMESVVLVSFYLWAALFMATVLSATKFFNARYGIRRNLYGSFLIGFLFVSGYNSVILHKEILHSNHFSRFQSVNNFVAIVDGSVQEKDHSFKTILSVVEIRKEGKGMKAEGRILTYFAKDSLAKPPEEGSTIIFSGNVVPISPPSNPGAFDYRSYMAMNNIYHQIYLKKDSYRVLDKSKGFSIYRTVHQVQRRFVNILNQCGLRGQEFAVASALILGQTDMLDSETMMSYSGTGAIHILSVSGLHVGVIYIVIGFLLGFMKKESYQLYIKTLIVLVTIWAYALLTGMSPPVLRSAAMFTFISIGTLSKRNVDIINSLSVSAFALLLIDPLMISNIGFQLSYLAIVGIVFFQKPIEGFWEPKTKLGYRIWQLVAVSLAAQLVTAPLTIMYFHQFPVYFIPANLIAIPLSFLAIYSGLCVLVFSSVPFVGTFMGTVTDFLLLVMNKTLGFIEKLPGSVIHINNVFTVEALLFSALLVSILLLIYLKRKVYFFACLVLVLAISVKLTSTDVNRQRQHKLVVYHLNKLSSIGLIDGKYQVLLASQTLLNDKKAQKFGLDGAKDLFGISKVDAVALDSLEHPLGLRSCLVVPLKGIGSYVLFHNKRICIADSLPKPIGRFAPLRVDYLVIRKNPRLRIANLKKYFEGETVVLDGSNSEYHHKKWVQDCKNLDIPVYSTKDDGALVVDFD